MYLSTSFCSFFYLSCNGGSNPQKNINYMKRTLTLVKLVVISQKAYKRLGKELKEWIPQTSHMVTSIVCRSVNNAIPFRTPITCKQMINGFRHRETCYTLESSVKKRWSAKFQYESNYH